jgi:hypothetical protein
MDRAIRAYTAVQQAQDIREYAKYAQSSYDGAGSRRFNPPAECSRNRPTAAPARRVSLASVHRPVIIWMDRLNIGERVLAAIGDRSPMGNLIVATILCLGPGTIGLDV